MLDSAIDTTVVLSGLDFDIPCESGHGGKATVEEHPAEYISYWTCGCPLFVCTSQLIKAMNATEPFWCEDCDAEETVLFGYEPLRRK